MAKQELKRRLAKVNVDEVSLVPKGAVPGSDFIVLSKMRKDNDVDTTAEAPVESEIVSLTKTLTSNEAFDAASMLRILAEITELAAILRERKMGLPGDVVSALDSLKAAMFEDDIEKSGGGKKKSDEDDDEVSDEEHVAKAITVDQLTEIISKAINDRLGDETGGTEEETVTKSGSTETAEGGGMTVAEQASALLKEQDNQRERAQNEHLSSLIDNLTTSVRKRDEKRESKLERVEEAYSLATGQET